MSTQTEINRLKKAKTDILTAISKKKVTVPTATKLDGLAPLIEAIPTAGDDLNYCCMAVLSASDLPSAPKENTIAVVTNVPVSSYWLDSGTLGKEEGRVHIKGSSGAWIQLIKKPENHNAVAYLESCVQYVSGSEKLLDAYVYKNGQWVQFSKAKQYLIKDGKPTGLMGTPVFWDTANGHNGSISYNSYYITVNVDGWSNGWRWGLLTSEGKVTLTPYSKLYCVIEQQYATRAGGSPNLCIKSTPYANGDVSSTSGINNSSKQTLLLDISSMTGSYYVAASSPGRDVNAGNTFWVYDMWLE